jgi:hypothetical protein
MQSGSPPLPLSHDALEAAKWIALVAMTIDHYGKIVNPDLGSVTHAIGRIAFPLFAGIIGLRIALSPTVVASYLRRLGFWAVLSQPVFVVAGRQWSEGNILFTLLLGVVADVGVVTLLRSRPLRAIALLAPAAVAAQYVEFGVAGVASVPLIARAAAAAGSDAGLWLIGPVGVMSNLVLRSPYLSPVDLFALAATPVAIASASIRHAVPRLPRTAFYAYYPAHLYALHWLDLHLT